MEKIFAFFVVMQLWSVIYTSEIPDVHLIYNIPAESDQGDNFTVDAEIHAMSNSLGKLFLLENKTIISPTASRSLPPFDCFPKSPSCKWRSSEKWNSSISELPLKKLSLPLHGFNLGCEYNNGGCQISCQKSHDKSLCSCPTGFSLNKDNKTCSGKASFHYILTGDTGEFTSPNYPNAYVNGLLCRWLIITSKMTRIHLTISNLETEQGYDFVYVYDGTEKEVRKYHGKGSYLSIRSTENIMMVQFTTDGSNVRKGFRASYITDDIQPLSTPKLEDERGVIKSSVNISQSNLCVSLIYSLPSSGSLNIFAEQSTADKTFFKAIHRNEINGWIISRFVSNSTLDARDHSTSLSVVLIGRNSQILNVAECSSNDEDVYLLPSMIWRRSDRKYPNSNTGLSHIEDHANNNLLLCNHGGKYDRNTEKCVCRVGFAGPKCTEACGPNHFGNNCSGLCSSFEDGCRKKIVCNALQYCTCAAGFTGENCEEECEPGTYGTNCDNECGLCKEGWCDIYTGECNGVCEEGYQPPLCQHRYAFLRQAPIVKETSWNNVVILINFTNTNGVGTPYLYEVQYKESSSYKWNKTSIQEIHSRSEILTNVTGLRVGSQYSLRVVITCEDGNSYEGFDVPIVEFETLCQVPNSNVYEVESRNITSSSFDLTWNYPVHSNKWCTINLFETILQDNWKSFSRSVGRNTETTFYTLLPARVYTVYVCAITKNGKAPCSLPFAVTTRAKAPGRVKNLIVESRNARGIHISWRRPLFTEGSTMKYRIQYKCERRFICEESCSHSNGSIETTQHSANLTNLLAHSQYKIRVAAYSSSQGPETILFATTRTTYPNVAPVASDQPIVSKTNTSVTIQWQPPPCPGRNGQLTGYYFTLTTETENGETVIQYGTTTETQTNFPSLIPLSDYQVNIYAVNSHGFDTNYKLTIPISTSATVPDAVQNLQVYKKGRRMIGIRWAEPTRVYGSLKSFTVAYHQKGSKNTFSQTVPPSPCSGWPHLYCYTINKNLQPDKQYIVSVSARNNEIEEDGMTSEINTLTRENAPEAPSSLKITKSTSTSFEIDWGLPNTFNGELRSFLVNVEHIESLNESECCEYFPVHELPFREESPVYNLEVTGLIPASAYVVSVSAKTITLGPSINATYYTSPLPPTDLKSPQVVGVADDGYSYLFNIEPSSMVLSSNSTYLLLVLPPGEAPPPVIWEKVLLEKLSKTVNASFYIVSEFTRDEFESAQEVKIGTGGEIKNGTVGQLVDPKFVAGYYQVGLALVQRYGQAISVGLAFSNRLEFGKISD